MSDWKTSACILCECNCGIEVQLGGKDEREIVRIRGDGDVPYQRIVEVIDTCQKSGIWNISFATQRPEPTQ